MRTESHSISDVLTKNATSFFIPPFQRAYAWGKVEIERYFSDIIRIITSQLNPKEQDKLEHFFGTVVFREEQQGFAHKSIVVDGQQRLTTTLLFLIALRDVETNREFKEKITNRYLRNDDSDFEDKIKLKQVTKDWDAYKALVNEKEPNAGCIKAAYQIFTRLIKDVQKKHPQIKPEHYILAIQRMNVAVIFLDERPHKGEDPQIIFETLNSLGKALTLADLVRNYILLSLDSEKQSLLYENYWEPKIEAELEGSLSKFYRDYLQYKTRSSIKIVKDDKVDSNTKEVYQLFKDFVNDSFSTREEFVDDIIPFVRWYKWIITEEVKDAILADPANDKELKELLRNIFHDIKSEAFKPFLLGLFEYNQQGVQGVWLSDMQFLETLKVIRTYLIRRRIMGLTQGENKHMVLLSGKIERISIFSLSMLDLLSNLYYKLRLPNDMEITEHLKSVDFYNGLKKYSKFILGKIEENYTKVAVDFRDKNITIQHIMPQTLSKSWKLELGEGYENIHRQYLHNIGNLILTEFDSEIGNQSFENKKEKLKTSSLAFRINVIGEEFWGEEEIKRHRDHLIFSFLKTFPLPESKQSLDNWNTMIVKKLNFSPLNMDAGEIAEGNRPKKIVINKKDIYVGSWQDVFLEFLKWVKESRVNDFDFIIGSQKILFNKDDVIMKWKYLKPTIEENPEYRTRYKTYDGYFWDDRRVVLNDDLEFVHINASARQLLNRVACVMRYLELDADILEIQL